MVVAPENNESGMRNLVMEGGYTLPILLDEGDVGNAYKVRYVPTLFVVDSAGTLVDRVVGATDFNQLNEIVDGLGGE